MLGVLLANVSSCLLTSVKLDLYSEATAACKTPAAAANQTTSTHMEAARGALLARGGHVDVPNGVEADGSGV